VWDTEHNNGVLIYVLLADKDVEIVATAALTGKWGRMRWARRSATRWSQPSAKDDSEEGAIDGITAINKLLRNIFRAAPQGRTSCRTSRCAVNRCPGERFVGAEFIRPRARNVTPRANKFAPTKDSGVRRAEFIRPRREMQRCVRINSHYKNSHLRVAGLRLRALAGDQVHQVARREILPMAPHHERIAPGDEQAET